MSSARASTASRTAFGALLVLAAAGLVTDLEGLHLAAVVGLCVVLTVASASEPTRAGAVAWGAAAILLYLAGVAARGALHGVSTGDPLELAITWLGVPVGVGLLSRQAYEMSRRFASATTTSEIARAKLVRSNRELVLSMEKNAAALGKLSAIVDNLADGLVAADADGRIEIANPALARLLERDAVEADARLEDVLPPAMQRLVRRCLEAEEVLAEEIALPAGRWALATVSPIHVQGALWGTVMLVHDVTLKREIDRMKSDFVATVSHEMRTPLTSLLGFTRLIQKQLDRHVFPAVPEDAAKARGAAETVRGNLEVIGREGRRLTALIDDVLDLSQMESGQMTWEEADHAVADLARRAVETAGPRFEAKPAVRLSLELGEDLPTVRVDGRRIEQVLARLLDNALKFTDEGEVVVEVARRGDVVELAVRDTGEGIRPGHQEVIFETFRQVGEILTDRPQGTGLGLPICREIVAHHGGTITVESELGVGSRFAFVLPLAHVTEADA